MPNLRLAVRTLARAPFVTAVAVLSLALGIGANTAIFSMFHRLLRQPLPVPNPGRLVNVAGSAPNPGYQSCGNAGGCDVILSYPMFRDLERGQTVLTGLAGHRDFAANLAYQGQSQEARGLLVSGSYFPVLGLTPALGRLLGPGDDVTIGGHFVAVLSYDYWQSRLAGDPGVVGRPLAINGHPMTIIGVAPRGFQGTTLGGRPPHVFVPLTMRSVVMPWTDDLNERRSYWIYAFGRLKPGVSIDQAWAGLNAIYHPIIDDVEAPLQTGMSPATMKRFRAKTLGVEPGPRGQSDVGTEAAAPLALLFAVTGIVLLIACLNVANLLVARAATRAKEMAVRLSLGASRRQLLGQLLAESALLALVAGGFSLFVAHWTIDVVTGMLPPERAASFDFSLDPPALAFTAILSLGTGLLFGLVPALQSTRPEIISVIKADSGRTAGTRSGSRIRRGMATTQIALSMALLSSAGLFIRSLVNLSRADLGLQIDDVVTFSIAPELNGYSHERAGILFRRLEEELAGLPGVAGVTAAAVPILVGDSWGGRVSVEGFKRGPDTDADSRLNWVGPGYFATIGLPVLRGREFTPADDVGGPKVAMVNQAFARKFHLGSDAVGKRMAVGGDEGQPLDLEIVGLVQDAKYNDVKGPIPPQVFRPYRQDTTLGFMTFYLRARGPTPPVVRAVPGVMARLDPTLPVSELQTVRQGIAGRLVIDRMLGVFSAAFAGLATLLAAVGLYGLLAYLVAQRTREIGVRMALGADRGQVRRMVLGQVGRMVVVGGVIGAAGAIGIGRAARSMLFEIGGGDPLAIAGAAGLLGLVAFGAGYVPARRASEVDPVTALRSE